MKKRLLAISAFTAFLSGSASATVIQEWNFTGGSLLSETGQSAGDFFSNSGANPDTSGNDWYNITHGAANSPAWLGTTLSAANADKVVISVTLNDFDFSAGGDQKFVVVPMSDTWTWQGVMGFDAADLGTRTLIQGSLGDPNGWDWISGGVAVDAVAGGPITYGMTYDFVNNETSLWIGSPDSGSETWVQDWGRTHAEDLSGVSISGLNFNIENHVAGDSFGVDQIKVEVIPEPATLGLISAAGIGVVAIRRLFMI